MGTLSWRQEHDGLWRLIGSRLTRSHKLVVKRLESGSYELLVDWQRRATTSTLSAAMDAGEQISTANGWITYSDAQLRRRRTSPAQTRLLDQLAHKMGELRRDELVAWRDHPTMVPHEWREPTGVELYNASEVRLTGPGQDQVLWSRIGNGTATDHPVASMPAPEEPASPRVSLASMTTIDDATIGVPALDIYAERMHRCLADDPEGRNRSREGPHRGDRQTCARG